MKYSIFQTSADYCDKYNVSDMQLDYLRFHTLREDARSGEPVLSKATVAYLKRQDVENLYDISTMSLAELVQDMTVTNKNVHETLKWVNTHHGLLREVGENAWLRKFGAISVPTYQQLGDKISDHLVEGECLTDQEYPEWKRGFLHRVKKSPSIGDDQTSNDDLAKQDAVLENEENSDAITWDDFVQGRKQSFDVPHRQKTAEEFEKDYDIVKAETNYLRFHEIENSGFSLLNTRARNSLDRLGVRSLYDLRSFDKNTLKKSTKLGEKSMKTITEWVSSRGGLWLDDYRELTQKELAEKLARGQQRTTDWTPDWQEQLDEYDQSEAKSLIEMMADKMLSKSQQYQQAMDKIAAQNFTNRSYEDKDIPQFATSEEYELAYGITGEDLKHLRFHEVEISGSRILNKTAMKSLPRARIISLYDLRNRNWDELQQQTQMGSYTMSAVRSWKSTWGGVTLDDYQSYPKEHIVDLLQLGRKITTKHYPNWEQRMIELDASGANSLGILATDKALDLVLNGCAERSASGNQQPEIIEVTENSVNGISETEQPEAYHKEYFVHSRVSELIDKNREDFFTPLREADYNFLRPLDGTVIDGGKVLHLVADVAMLTREQFTAAKFQYCVSIENALRSSNLTIDIRGVAAKAYDDWINEESVEAQKKRDIEARQREMAAMFSINLDTVKIAQAKLILPSPKQD